MLWLRSKKTQMNSKAKSKVFGFSSARVFHQFSGVRCSPLLRFYSSTSVKGYTKRNIILAHFDEQAGTLCQANLDEDQIALTRISRLETNKMMCLGLVPQSRSAESTTRTKAMFRKTKTRDFKVFLAFLLLFSGKRNAFLCLILNPVSLQTMITKHFLSFISSVALFSTPHHL